MELKEILSQNLQKASSKSNHISGPSGHSKEAFYTTQNLLENILRIFEFMDNRKSYLEAHYGVISCSLMQTSNGNLSVLTRHLLSKNTHQTKI